MCGRRIEPSAYVSDEARTTHTYRERERGMHECSTNETLSLISVAVFKCVFFFSVFDKRAYNLRALHHLLTSQLIHSGWVYLFMRTVEAN